MSYPCPSRVGDGGWGGKRWSLRSLTTQAILWLFYDDKLQKADAQPQDACSTVSFCWQRSLSEHGEPIVSQHKCFTRLLQRAGFLNQSQTSVLTIPSCSKFLLLSIVVTLSFFSQSPWKTHLLTTVNDVSLVCVSSDVDSVLSWIFD